LPWWNNARYKHNLNKEKGKKPVRKKKKKKWKEESNEENVCNRVLFSYFSPSIPAFRRLSLIRLGLFSFRSTTRSSLRSFACTPASFRSLFRACTLCYPANINGAERTIQQRTMQSMNDGIVCGTCSGRDDFSYLRSSFSPSLFTLRDHTHTGLSVVRFSFTLYTCMHTHTHTHTHTYACTHAHFRAPLTLTSSSASSFLPSSPSVYTLPYFLRPVCLTRVFHWIQEGSPQ